MSPDAKGELMDFVENAKKKGLTEIGISDHFHFTEPSYSMTLKNLPGYVRKIETAKIRSGFPLKLGLEVDYLKGYEDRIRKVLCGPEFDYLIGSVHFIDGWGFDDPRQTANFQKWNMDELYSTYFSLVNECAESKLFDVVGHVDLIRKFGHKPKGDMTSVFLQMIESLKKGNVCVEVNTNGLHAPCNEIYPSKFFLKLCFEHGIPVALGSDAHSPESVGQEFEKALILLQEIGYAQMAGLTKRKRGLIDL
jgi:histidinol-phosphatase (PHP family)